LKVVAKKGGKKQISPLLATTWKNFGKPPSALPGRTPSDAHVLNALWQNKGWLF